MSKPENDKLRAVEDRERLEAKFTRWRIVELELNPVRGTFDATHLKEINRRIFQDLPDLGFEDVTPGRYRPPVPPGKDWIKNRSLESVGGSSYVTYSSLDKAAQARLDEALKLANPVELGRLKTADFTKAVATLYAEIDYVHPFLDGNSRTLRTFTKQLAREAGYELDWERFNRSTAGRDILYVARDKSVNELALPHIQNHDTRRSVVFSMDQLEGNRSLPELLRDAIRPSRAIAFEQKTEAEALHDYPELADAYKILHTAAKYFETKIPNDIAARSNAVAVVVESIQIRLDEGEIHDFRPSANKTHQKEGVDKTFSNMKDSERNR